MTSTPPDAAPDHRAHRGGELTAQVNAMRAQMETLQRRLSTPDESETHDATLETLRLTWEELQVADEELRHQNEELQRAQLALEAERERYRALFEFAPDGYFVTDAHGLILEANRAAGEMLHVSSRFLRHKPLANFVAMEQRHDFRVLVHRLQSDGRHESEFIMAPRHGPGFAAALTVAVVRGDGPDDALTLRWLLRDVTARKVAEQALRDLHQGMTDILENMADGFITLDHEWRVVYVNAAAERITGLSRNAMNGRFYRAVWPRLVGTSVEAEIRRAAAARREAAFEYFHESWQRWFDFKIYPHRGGLAVHFRDITGRRRGEQARRQLMQRIVDAQEEERARISRELHDQLGQNLTALKLGLAALPSGTGETDAVTPLQELADTLMRQVHRLAWELRPSVLDDLGLEAALRRYLDEWSRHGGVEVDFHCNRLRERIPPALETTLYRVAQEALSNVRRHARARRVSVLLERDERHVAIIVEDDGIGFDAEDGETQRERLGLLGMRERVTLVAGTFTVESTPGHGTTIFARVPLLEG